MNSKERMILVLLAAINFTHILDFMIMMPLGNYLMPYFNINPRQFTLLVGAYTLSAGLSGFAAAFFVDRYDRKKVLLLGYVGFLLGTLACGVAPTYELLLASRLLAGLFGGLIGAQVLSIVSDVFSYERRGAAMGAVMSSFSIASTFGVPFALYLANAISWHAPFLFVGILGFIIVPLVQRNIPAMNSHINKSGVTENKWQVLTDVLAQPKQRWALAFSGLIMMGHFLIVPFINPYMEFNNGYSKKQTPLIYLVGGIAAFFAANILGRLSDRYGKMRVFQICILLSLPLVVVITQLPPIAFWIVLVFFALWFIVATGRGVTAQALVSNVVPPEKRGGFMSFNSSVQQLGTFTASLVAGFVVSNGPHNEIYRYGWLGYLSVAVLLLCLLVGRKIFSAAAVTTASKPS
jgi:MFS transporter, DHA1 family, inner membrane transport protein